MCITVATVNFLHKSTLVKWFYIRYLAMISDYNRKSNLKEVRKK